MKYITTVLIIGIALVASACVPSLHPLYTDKDLIFEPALLGEWVEAKPDSKSDGDLVLTASTKQLQSFVLRHVNDKSAFTDPTDYARKK